MEMEYFIIFEKTSHNMGECTANGLGTEPMPITNGDSTGSGYGELEIFFYKDGHSKTSYRQYYYYEK
jgi:hypothetical protein